MIDNPAGPEGLPIAAAGWGQEAGGEEGLQGFRIDFFFVLFFFSLEDLEKKVCRVFVGGLCSRW